jgi:TfoX/Sxy family transcriptional regulator of competence genes
MAYSEELARRIRRLLPDGDRTTERKMFGGLAFMVGGNMACGVIGDELMVRVGPEQVEAALAEPDARPMDFIGRPMKGMVYVAAKALRSDGALSTWVGRGAAYAGSLPAK